MTPDGLNERHLRDERALTLREDGLTYEAIGRCLGVTKSRAAQMVAKAIRRRHQFGIYQGRTVHALAAAIAHG